MYKNEKESIEIITIAINQNNLSLIFLEENNINNQIEKEKLIAMLRANRGGVDDDEDDVNELDDEILNIDLTKTDLKEAYLKLIFEPYRFSKSNIQKALGVLASTSFNETRLVKSNDDIKALIIQSIEKEVQSHPGYANCSEEEFLYLTSKCWSKFYTMLKQYDYDSRSPIGLFVDKDNESLVVLIRKVSFFKLFLIKTKQKFGFIRMLCQCLIVLISVSLTICLKLNQLKHISKRNITRVSEFVFKNFYFYL